MADIFGSVSTRGQRLAKAIDANNVRVANAIIASIRDNMRIVNTNADYKKEDGTFDVEQAYADFEANTTSSMTRVDLQKSLAVVKALCQMFFPSQLATMFPANSPLQVIFAAVPPATISFG